MGQDIVPSGNWLHGGVKLPGDPYTLWFITGPEESNIEHGLYRGKTLVVPGVTGNGVAFFPDGSAVIVQYNWNVGPLGQPGALLRIPTGML